MAMTAIVQRNRRSWGGATRARTAGAGIAALTSAAACVAASAAAGGCAQALPEVTLQPVGRAAIEGAEVVTFSPATGSLYVACAGGIARAGLGEAGEIGTPQALDLHLPVELGAAWGGGWGVTHVACDASGERMAACLVPSDFARVPGLVVIVDCRTGTVQHWVGVGFNPDACVFSEDGSAVIVANEGQPLVEGEEIVADPPGSVSVIDLARETPRVVTLEFGAGTPVRGAVRVHPGSAGLRADLEPEYATVLGDRAYVTCQENNAVLEVDWRAARLVEVRAIEALPLRMPGGTAAGVRALPMPDQIAAYVQDGRVKLVVAGEGDTRGKASESALGDVQTLAERSPALAPQGSGLERLQVCAFTGDPGEAFALGSRSLRVTDWADNATEFDTGAAFDAHWAAQAGPEDELFADRARSRGSEPEGLALWRHGGAIGAFVGLERASMIVLVDLGGGERESGSASALRGSYHAAGDVAPEGLLVLPAARWGGAFDLLVVSYEVSGSLVSYRIDAAR